MRKPCTSHCVEDESLHLLRVGGGGHYLVGEQRSHHEKNDADEQSDEEQDDFVAQKALEGDGADLH